MHDHDVNTDAGRKALNQRMWDLLRQQRMELHAEELISDEEYALLAQDHPAVKRLEDYDAAIAKIAELERELAEVRLERNAERERAEKNGAESRALQQKIAELRADGERLDWLEKALRDEGRWADISMKYDDEDGFWLSRIKRGIVLTEHNYEPAETAGPNPTIREAIDAARAAAGEEGKS